MKLMHRGVVGTGQHRSGWPRVMQSLRTASTGRGVLLDDFTCASFSYMPLKEPHSEPWCGIFHHPVHINSPLSGDRNQELRKISRHRHWEASRRTICGAIGLCEDVRRDLEKWLRVPTLNIWHPTDTNVPRWSLDAAMEFRTIVQAGYCMRNTQAIYQFPPPDGWNRANLFGASKHYASRNEHLRKVNARYGHDWERVAILPRQGNAEYDDLLSRCVILTELYGAAANNLVVECMVRGTPVLCNRLPSVEEYLGRDYPLFFDEFETAGRLIEPARLRAAHDQLLERAKLLPSFDEFAARVRDFCDSLGEP